METQQNNTDLNKNYEKITKQPKKEPGYDLPLLLWGWTFLFVSLSQYVIQAQVSSEQLKTILNIFGLLVGASAILVTIHFVVNRKPKSGKERIFKYYWLVVFVLYHIVPFFIDSNLTDYYAINIYRLTYVGVALIVWGLINNFVWLIYGGVLFGIAPLFINLIHLPYQYLVIASIWLIAYILPFLILIGQKRLIMFSPPRLDAAIS